MAQVICKTDDVPEGKGKTFEIDGKKVAVFKVEGNFYAVNDTCIHKGGPLGEGYLNDTVVTCPWHGWQFDVASGKSPVNPEAKIETYSVTVEGDDVLIDI